MNEPQEGAKVHQMEDGTEYRAHSMMHKAIVQMDPTKLEMLEGFERTKPGHKFSPKDTNVRLIISGRDWSEKRILIYGCQSSDEASEYIKRVIDRVQEVGHDAELMNDPEIMNIAVSGDFGTPLQLEKIAVSFRNKECDVEYEPEQFPAVIVKIEDPPATFLLFSTGKFSIQGIRNLENIERQINRIKDLIQSVSKD
jgi:TATA-box binding protein (TBP) (component of TFIID and TFIIIB)